MKTLAFLFASGIFGFAAPAFAAQDSTRSARTERARAAEDRSTSRNMAVLALTASELSLDLPDDQSAAIQGFRERFEDLSAKAARGDAPSRTALLRLTTRAPKLLNDEQWASLDSAVHRSLTTGEKTRRKAAEDAVSTAQALLSQGLAEPVSAIWLRPMPASARLSAASDSFLRAEETRQGFENFRTDGHAILPSGFFLDPEEESLILEAIESNYKRWSSPGEDRQLRERELFSHDQWWSLDRESAKAADHVVRRAIDKFTERLRSQFPKEKFKLQRVEVRVTDDAVPFYPSLHVDTTYSTWGYTFGDQEGLQTVLRKRSASGKSLAVQGPPRSLTGVTGREREAALGGKVSAPPHTIPRKTDRKTKVRHRVYIQIAFQSAEDVTPLLDTKLRKAINQRIYDTAEPGEEFVQFGTHFWTNRAIGWPSRFKYVKE